MKGNIEKILAKTCDVFGVSAEDIRSNKHNRNVFFARVVVAKHLRTLFPLSSTEIGQILCKDHSTVLRYLSVYDQEYRYNKEFRIFADKTKDIDLEIKSDFHEELEDELNEIIG